MGGLYARPISEPCNFIEASLSVVIPAGSNSVSLTHANILSLLDDFTDIGNIQKYRVSSLVLEQVTNSTNAGIASATVEMGISGQKYLWSNVLKPLRMRLGKEYGDDGMWIVNDGSALTDAALPGNEVTTDDFLTLAVSAVVPTGVTVSSVLHLRFAWQDPR